MIALAGFLAAKEGVTFVVGRRWTRWLPGELTTRLTGAAETSGRIGSLLLLALYIGAVVLAGIAVLRRPELG